MFGTILIFAVTAMHWYVVWRVGSVPLIRGVFSRNLITGLGMALWIGFCFGRVFGHSGTFTLAALLELFAMNWMGVIFLTSSSLFVVDVVTGFGFLFRRQAPSLRGLALVVGGALSLIAFVQGARPPVIQQHQVYLSTLPEAMEGTVLVAVSDLHMDSLRGKEWLERHVALIEAQHPDLVVMLGDLFEEYDQPDGELLSVLRRLSAPLGIWAVLGNHEFYRGQETAQAFLTKAGFQVLRNAWVSIRPDFVVAGVDDLTANHRFGGEEEAISKTLAGRPSGTTILLSHTPWQADRAAEAGVDLMLCGHTHGGQLWPFGYLVKRRYPLFQGRYEVGGTTVIVCRGTGTWGPRMRLWRPGEILRVTLYRKEEP